MRELPEERRVLFPNYVVVALAAVELQRGTTWVTSSVGAAALSGNRGEPDQRVLLSARLEHRSLGVGADLWSPRSVRRTRNPSGGAGTPESAPG